MTNLMNIKNEQSKEKSKRCIDFNKVNEKEVVSQSGNNLITKNTQEEMIAEENNKSIMNIRKKNVQALLGMLKIKSLEKETQSNKTRIQKTEFQKAVLKEVFSITRFPSRQTREDLAILLRHSSRGIQIWFQNQRNKLFIYEQGLEGERKRKKIFEKKKTVDLATLSNIVEKFMPEYDRIYWDSFINFDSEKNRYV